MSEILLGGLRADNPLAFMAALGALVTADSALGARGPCKLCWEFAGGAWRPRLAVPGNLAGPDLVKVLHQALHRDVSDAAQGKMAAASRGLKEVKTALKRAEKHLKDLPRGSPERAAAEREVLQPARDAVATAEAGQLRVGIDEGAAPDGSTALGPVIKVSAATFRAFADLAAEAARPGSRRLADFAAAFGCELIEDDGCIVPTRFSKQNGNSGKNMLADIARLMLEAREDQVAEALFGPWRYGDDGLSLGWDPSDVRPFALQAADPATGSVTVHGANLLAYEALPLFPTTVRGRGIATTGTSRLDRVECFTWAVWNRPASVPIVRSILSLPELQRGAPERTQLRAMGIVEIFRAEHFTTNKSTRFRPARAV